MKEQFLSIQTGPPFKRNLIYTTTTFVFFAGILFISNHIPVNNTTYIEIITFINKCVFLTKDITYQFTNITWFAYLIWIVSLIVLIMLFSSNLDAKLKVMIIILIIGTVFYQNMTIKEIDIPTPYWKN